MSLAFAFDTLKLVDTLEKVNLPRDQARAIVEVVRESHDITISEQAHIAQTASAQSVAELDSKTEQAITLLRKDMGSGFASVDARFTQADIRFAQIDARFDQMEAKMEAGFARADARMDAGFERADARMDAGFERADARMDVGFALLRKDMDALQNKLLIKLSLVMVTLFGLVEIAHRFFPRA